MQWNQDYFALHGSLLLTALVVAIPIFFLFWAIHFTTYQTCNLHAIHILNSMTDIILTKIESLNYNIN